ncbi:MAG TPA: hypothetical protein VES36_08515 [Candidatus Limnocylindrales bacterium]|nr:hypothetical protein [Candidatus Limnocylindrales bacterium]
MSTSSTITDPAADYERLAGSAAILAGLGGIVYSVAFLGGVVAGWAPELGTVVSSIALMVGGLLSVAVMVAVYRRIFSAAPAWALLGLVLVAIGSAGAVIHGGNDLANAINPPLSDVLGEAALPSPVDPRGLLTFGVSGLGLLLLAWQARGAAGLPPRLATLGVVVGLLLVLVYLGRLIVLTPTNPLVAGPAALTGLILSPAFYIWLGMELRRR